MVRNGITYTVEKAKDGFPTLVVHDGQRRIPIHSAYRPSEEGAIFKHRYNPDKFDTLIVLGGGLGYHLSGLAGVAEKYRRIIIVEYLEGLAGEIARNQLVSFLVSCPAVVFIEGLTPDDAEKRLSVLIDLESTKGVQLLEHPASVRAFPEYYRKVKSIVEKIINRSAGNLITKSRLSKRFFKNAVVNLGSFDTHFPFAQLYDAFNGRSALVIAAGPSLSNHLEKIKQNAHCIIIAVDSTLPVLSSQGIMPDFFVSIDPQPYVFEHLNADRGTAIPLVTLTSHPVAFSSGRGFLSLNSHPVAQFVQEASAVDIGSFHSASGSVAGDALMAALKMGFSKIGLIGLDSAFLRHETYPRGSAYQRRWGMYSQDRFATVESRNFRYIMHASGAVMHSGLYTRKSFITYRDAIDEMLRVTGKGRVRMIAPSGLPLSNAALCTFEEFIRECNEDAFQTKKTAEEIMRTTSSLAEIAPLNTIKRLLSNEVMARIVEASFPLDMGAAANALSFFKKQNYLNC